MNWVLFRQGLQQELDAVTLREQHVISVEPSCVRRIGAYIELFVVLRQELLAVLVEEALELIVPE